MAWTALVVAGAACIVTAAYLFAGLALALLVAGLAMVLIGLDGARPDPNGPRLDRKAS